MRQLIYNNELPRHICEVKGSLIILLIITCFGSVRGQDCTFLPKPKRSFVFRTYPPYVNSQDIPVLRNQTASFGRKFARASGLVLMVEAGCMIVLLNSNPDFSKWSRWGRSNLRAHYTAAYTLPPVIDKDDWFTDYVEHPYQGALDYNALRSQGAPIWQSALFVTLHSTLWEYVIEASEERPSIQDLIVTPIGGSLFGELAHFATMRMVKNGLTWYEFIAVIIINPAFILNNGFKLTRWNMCRAAFKN